MKVKVRNKKRRGVALVFAMFTVALLMSLSTTVVGLSIRHARSGLEVDFAGQALAACNWGVEAILNYISDDDAWNVNYYYGSKEVSNPYKDTRTLCTTKDDGSKLSAIKALGRSDVVPTVVSLDKTKRNDYGLADTTTNGFLVRFSTPTGPLVFFPSSGNGPHSTMDDNESFAINEVAIGEDRSTVVGGVGVMHIISYTRVYKGDVFTDVTSKVNAAYASGAVGPDAYPTEGLLATRVTETWARPSSVQDYLHIIQNGRSWRAQGINLDGANGLFEQYQSGNDQALKNGLLNCGFPEGYEENGRLRIDGGTRMKDARGGVVIDGSAQFFNYNKSSNYASFASELTQQRSKDTIAYANSSGHDYLGSVLGGGINDSCDSIGLPQSGENANYDKNGNKIYKAYEDRKTYQSFAKETAKDTTGQKGTTKCAYDIGGKVGKVNSDASKVYVNSYPKTTSGANSVPDVFARTDGDDVRPSFAKIVVTLGEGDKVTITKVNEAVPASNSHRSAVLYSGKASKINNGIISVTGGNVEVQSETNSKGEPAKFSGQLTVVADVEATREDSLNYYNDDKGASIKSASSIYSDAAREYYDNHPDQSPPYKVSTVRKDSQRTINDKCLTAANDAAYIWPTPTSEATEREGNVYVTSDIACKNDTTGVRGCVGIVAKNYVSLNDKTLSKKNPGGSTASSSGVGKETLSIEAMLYSFDKSVQFDWTNDAGNTAAQFQRLKTHAKDRLFKLTGSVVSSELDIEGSEEGVGYIQQEERSNVGIDNAPPFTPAYSGEIGWVILNTIDRGSANWF